MSLCKRNAVEPVELTEVSALPTAEVSEEQLTEGRQAQCVEGKLMLVRGLRRGAAGVGSYKGKDLSFLVRVLFVGMGVCVLTVGVPTRTPEEGSSH